MSLSFVNQVLTLQSSPSGDSDREEKPRRVVENPQFDAFARRILRAYGRRVASGDIEALRAMVGLADQLDAAITEAVRGLRQYGYSWAEIGDRLGTSRQAAQQRWGGDK